MRQERSALRGDCAAVDGVVVMVEGGLGVVVVVGDELMMVMGGCVWMDGWMNE